MKILAVISSIQDPAIKSIIESRLNLSYYDNQPITDIYDVILYGWDWGNEFASWSLVYESKNIELIKELFD